jgi:voltage-gated potassium channel
VASVVDLANVPLFRDPDPNDLAKVAEGDFFGEMAILGDGRRTATVTSTSPVRLLVMFGTEFRRLEAEYPMIASRLTDGMQVRARELAALA